MIKLASVNIGTTTGKKKNEPEKKTTAANNTDCVLQALNYK